MNEQTRWVAGEADPVDDPSRLPYEVRDYEGDRRADFLIRGDAERYVRDRNREAGIATETGDAAGEVGEAMRGRLDDLALIREAIDSHTVSDPDAAESLGFELEGGEPLEDQAEQLLDKFPLCVEATTTFEVVLGTGGPDDRLLFECDVAPHSEGEPEYGNRYEIRRVLYRYSWSGSAERVLTGEDRKVAEVLALRVVPELAL